MIVSMNKQNTLSMVPDAFRTGFYCAALSITVFMSAACAGGPSAPAQTPGFSAVLGKDWRLVEIRAEAGGVNLDRSVMEIEGVGDAFTLRFEEDRVNGVALPNRYFGPYTQEGQAISFQAIASTLMASSRELDALKEREYFAYLEQVQSWAWRQGRLELHSAAPDGRQVVLIFDQAASSNN
jgi:heat shock protein HslJ